MQRLLPNGGFTILVGVPNWQRIRLPDLMERNRMGARWGVSVRAVLRQECSIERRAHPAAAAAAAVAIAAAAAAAAVAAAAAAAAADVADAS